MSPEREITLVPPFKVQLACVLTLLALVAFAAEDIAAWMRTLGSAAPAREVQSSAQRCPDPAEGETLIVTIKVRDGKRVRDCFLLQPRGARP